ncbi:MAG: dTDP-4-dehydrorhamnose reductase [Porticoccaceae bacterium]
MKILVTGAAGQVGSELVERGKAMGLNMIAASSAELDITCYETVTEYVTKTSPDIIINAAAYTAVDKAEDEPELAFAVNRDGPANLAKACAVKHIPLLHISTDYVFSGSSTDPCREDDAANPVGVYGSSKLAGEQAVASHLTQYIILRVAWVFGANGQNFVRTMLRLGGENEELSVVADQHGCPTWAGDIADTLLTIATRYREQGDLPWGSYHYMGAPATTWYGFAETIFEQAQGLGMLDKSPVVHPVTSEQYPTAAQRPKNSVLDCDKIQRVFGINQPDWRAGLASVLNTWKQQ